MKKIYTIIAAGLMLTASIFAQAPEKMSYQAVLRDASNALTTNQTVGIQISILQGGATGTAVYVETQAPTTNANGLLTLEIGTGTVISGNFTTIDWANDTYFIKTETDPTGGTNYTITGTTQLMSAPYALHAKTAKSITGTVNYTETDPIFGASVANGITALDTANWNNHTVDTDTQLDSTAIANMGFVAGGGSPPSRISIQGFDDDLVDFGNMGVFSGASSSSTDAATLGSQLQIGSVTTTYANGGSDITLTSNQFNIASAGTYEIFISFSVNNFGIGSNNILQLANNGTTIATSVSSSDNSSNGNPATMVIKYVGAFAASDVIRLHYKNDAGSGWRGKSISLDIQKID